MRNNKYTEKKELSSGSSFFDFIQHHQGPNAAHSGLEEARGAVRLCHPGEII